MVVLYIPSDLCVWLIKESNTQTKTFGFVMFLMNAIEQIKL